MGGLLKMLIFFGIIFFGYRLITKPFRDYVKAAKKQSRVRERANEQQKHEEKTNDLGDYIDYEEVED